MMKIMDMYFKNLHQGKFWRFKFQWCSFVNATAGDRVGTCVTFVNATAGDRVGTCVTSLNVDWFDVLMKIP